ncbi:ATP-dependent DNA helicase RuvB [Thermotoga maritima MSB8]|uniref:Holliday junction branch migration complex subunit RuvB n=1 Tax=Thermotoga maritima (strain ATCC 43589 / DSM 3109 / JCM 10099 / NBRC 100826 / MSB8) TaxID=243274 RepID=RUVB_THEMA|nr:Holliday junction branch migration DNA helicase RuvB [Thermotoga maritima]Q56313.1 RecName: Full=Holliday junction branch migration complex subunit RuvB [Thermotoga maritima MSB8]1IN4_A Chain A, Holliday Junction Dna Helicase Ruvb [Thermotoga maritima]AAB03727.1 RuvB protein [Thermotoga maritima]AAD36795.1 Holliday junction DNA helicase [Thermotoga maritima MSB8]AGL50662.1 Holliday junction DNA helicase RuvB [Thermotoga maritima MSB8]AHD18376.1 Holliday junction DNA helicase RuvB [Thermoto
MSEFLTPERTVYDSGVQFLRPKSLDEFIGQENVKKKLSLALEAAKMRGEVLDHVLLAGPPGLGKTTLAHIIASELQTNIHVTSGPVLVKQGDMAAILTSLERGDVLFIDEIHRLNKAVEELLYSAIEDFQIDIMIGKGPSAKSIRIDIQPFTLVGATTRSGLLSSPLRSRFGIILELDFYTVKELKEIIKRAASLMDVEIEDAAAEMIAKRSRGTPRIAIRLTKRVRDMLTVVKADRINTDIVLKTMEVLNIDDEGLDEFDRKILKTIIEIYRGGPVGLNALAASLGVEADTLSEVYEPYLLQAGFLARTPRGRIVTEKAYKHLKYEVPENRLF